MSKSGKVKILYRFNGITDGYAPHAALVFDSAGNLYGSTVHGPWGGCPWTGSGCGTIWKLNLSPTTDTWDTP